MESYCDMLRWPCHIMYIHGYHWIMCGFILIAFLYHGFVVLKWWETGADETKAQTYSCNIRRRREGISHAIGWLNYFSFFLYISSFLKDRPRVLHGDSHRKPLCGCSGRSCILCRSLCLPEERGADGQIACRARGSLRFPLRVYHKLALRLWASFSSVLFISKNMLSVLPVLPEKWWISVLSMLGSVDAELRWKAIKDKKRKTNREIT